jgi:HSP20 family protein
MWWMTNETNEVSPFNRIRRLQDEMNRLFDGSVYREPFPAVNIWSDAEHLELRAEMPGVDPKDLHISTLGDQLTIEGEVKPEHAGEKAVWHRQERFTGKFSRAFRLPYEIDGSKVTAKCANGVLRVSMARVESSKPRKITVDVE